MLYFSECLVCVFCLLTQFLSLLFSFHRKKLVFSLVSNQQIYDFCKWIIFEKKRLWNVNFWYQWIIHLIIKCIKGSCCEHITGGVNVYLFRCVSLLTPDCAVCVQGLIEKNNMGVGFLRVTAFLWARKFFNFEVV